MEISPATPEELAAPPFLFNESNRSILDGTGFGTFGFQRKAWIFGAVLLGVMLVPWMTIRERTALPDGILLTIAFTGFVSHLFGLIFFPALLISTLQRRRLREKGRVLRGVAECMSASLAATDDSGEEAEFIVKLQYAFVTPEGRTLEGVNTETAYGDGLRYLKTKEIVYARWPKVGERIPIAVLYVGPRTHEIL